MKRLIALILSTFAILFTVNISLNEAGAQDAIEWSTEDMGDDELLSQQELEVLLAPIALYPDPLIAQILPAATFINEIEEAARYLRRKGTSAKVDGKDWDVSVKAVAHYPNVLYMMDERYDWTVSLGQAYIRQQQEVMDTIQRLRARAKAAGGLVSTPQQQVIVEDRVIRVVPAEPNIIYIPSYDPQYLYVDTYSPSYGFITFGLGFTLGAWLNRDLDWHNHRIYYHGWRGDGWIRRSRPHLHFRNNIYINRNHGYIDYNRRIFQHDNWRYRNDIRRNLYQRGVSPPSSTPGTIIRQRNRFDRRSYPPAAAPRTSPPPSAPQTTPPVMQPRRGGVRQELSPGPAPGRTPSQESAPPPAPSVQTPLPAPAPPVRGLERR